MMDFRWLPPSEVQQLNRESRELGAHPSMSTRFGRIRHAVPLRQPQPARPTSRS